MIALNNVATANAYTEPTTRRQAGSVRVNVLVGNAAIYLQLADGQQNFGPFDEEFLPPGAYSLNRLCGGARIRSAAAGVSALVTLVLLEAADLPA